MWYVSTSLDMLHHSLYSCYGQTMDWGLCQRKIHITIKYIVQYYVIIMVSCKIYLWYIVQHRTWPSLPERVYPAQHELPGSTSPSSLWQHFWSLPDSCTGTLPDSEVSQSPPCCLGYHSARPIPLSWHKARDEYIHIWLSAGQTWLQTFTDSMSHLAIYGNNMMT